MVSRLLAPYFPALPEHNCPGQAFAAFKFVTKEGNRVFDSGGTISLFTSNQFKGPTPVTRAHGALSKE